MKNVPKNKTQVGNGAGEEKRQPIACFRARKQTQPLPCPAEFRHPAPRQWGQGMASGSALWVSAVSLRLGNQEAAGKGPGAFLKTIKGVGT